MNCSIQSLLIGQKTYLVRVVYSSVAINHPNASQGLSRGGSILDVVSSTTRVKTCHQSKKKDNNNNALKTTEESHSTRASICIVV